MSEAHFNRQGAVIIGSRPCAQPLVASVASRAMFDSLFGPEAKAAEGRRRVSELRKACGVEAAEVEGVITVARIHAVINAIDEAAK